MEAYIAHLLDRFSAGTAVTRYQDLWVLGCPWPAGTRALVGDQVATHGRRRADR